MVLKLHNYEESYTPIRFVLGETFTISSPIITVCAVSRWQWAFSAGVELIVSRKI